MRGKIHIQKYGGQKTKIKTKTSLITKIKIPAPVAQDVDAAQRY